MPVETRTLAPVMPAARRAAGVMEAWLMVSGCSTRDSTPPRDSAKAKILSAWMKRNAARLPGAQGFGEGEDFERLDETKRGPFAAANIEREHAAEAGHLLSGQAVLRV